MLDLKLKLQKAARGYIVDGQIRQFVNEIGDRWIVPNKHDAAEVIIEQSNRAQKHRRAREIEAVIIRYAVSWQTDR